MNGTQVIITILKPPMLIKSSPLPCWLNAQNTAVAVALIKFGFLYEGELEGDDIDTTEAVIQGWLVGCKCCENSIVAIFDGAVFSSSHDDESDSELRYNQVKKLIRATLRSYKPFNPYEQLQLFKQDHDQP
ncbi:hypothetical protein PN465_10965 [Nodularia spumigena CS-584]|jgi:hypothetical protein|uniref:Uncharacterized protein n=1 Tax=Nodularia spumigena UHCC 0060 TaxID=3110300 RepID=A0ABU5UZ64_NODSP|nr:hypothetical protein [Nodularia spumigena]EAW44643.1 hypothetical protein N9414_06239 [Nodularia spumigena CCY9414]MDB9382738.1 hypothetical protein [Nodularia spumigena CS-584]MEA5527813.1 hypothetical protein [Nodularia spumigena UHCC 0143]MEA5611034.1 hypothetical protein [Nodularia spumigena UHCC 0060]MEA5616078.1 hypothetical protein [Nodularia spumigena UHCC 0040]